METIAADRADREDHQTRPEEHEPHDEKLELLRIGLVAVAVLATWFQVWRPVPRFDLVALFATAVGGYPVFREALSNLFARRMTMELRSEERRVGKECRS